MNRKSIFIASIYALFGQINVTGGQRVSKGGDREIFNNGNAPKCDAPRTETPVSWSWRGKGATPSSGGSLPPAESAGIIMIINSPVCVFVPQCAYYEELKAWSYCQSRWTRD